ncbi:MAG TPA: CPBP family intramembrane glutamic endopeptidase [Anaerolineales bacterium]|nr:CPBP family intramembrane glutamic endopeptidase [Anaerolineales bacterium]
MSTLTSVVSAHENGFKAWVKRHPLISMYAFLFALAWAVMVPQALYSQGIISAPLPLWLEILTGWAPGIAAVSVAAIASGRAGVRDLLGRFRIWRVGVQWYLVSLFALAALILGGIGLHVLFGGAMPSIPSAGIPLWQIALIFTVTVFVGVLVNTEEIAWRGFALPRLQARYNVLVAAVLLAIPELALHLPLFFVKENPFYPTVGLAAFSAFSVAMVFIYAFVFNKTRGSLLIVTLMHASQNAWANLLSDNSARPFHFTVALAWMIAIALILITKGQLGYEPEQTAR